MKPQGLVSACDPNLTTRRGRLPAVHLRGPAPPSLVFSAAIVRRSRFTPYQLGFESTVGFWRVLLSLGYQLQGGSLASRGETQVTGLLPPAACSRKRSRQVVGMLCRVDGSPEGTGSALVLG